MKVIVMAQALLPWSGGCAISEASLSSHLAKYCSVTVLCRKGKLDYAFARSYGLNEVLQYEPADVLKAWREPNHWLNQILAEADVLHLNGHWRWEDHFFARLCVKIKLPYLLQPRGMLLLGHRRVALKRLYNLALGNFLVEHASRIIALSRFEVEQFQPYAVEPDRIVVLPNGIPSAPDLPEGLKFNPPHGKGSFFLYLGRLESRKNLLFLIEVFALYVAKGGKSCLLLAGPVERGYDIQLHEKINQLGMQRQIFLMKPVYEPEKWLYLKNAQAIIYPTLDEPFGRVPFEAISAGSLPIVPDESGSAEYLQTFLPECIYQHQNAESLLQTMVSAESANATGESEGLKRAKAWVKEELDWDRIAQVVTSIYGEILENKVKPVHRIEADSNFETHSKVN